MILLLFCCSNDIPKCNTIERCLRSSLNRNSIIAVISEKPVSFVCRSKNLISPNDKKPVFCFWNCGTFVSILS